VPGETDSDVWSDGPEVRAGRLLAKRARRPMAEANTMVVVTPERTTRSAKPAPPAAPTTPAGVPLDEDALFSAPILDDDDDISLPTPIRKNKQDYGALVQRAFASSRAAAWTQTRYRTQALRREVPQLEGKDLASQERRHGGGSHPAESPLCRPHRQRHQAAGFRALLSEEQAEPDSE
jgi:hypothetical protein